MITAVLADDHPIVRQGLRALLEGESGCQVIAEASDGLTALRQVVELKPVLAVLDVQLPDLNGLEVARRLQTEAPDTRVIMLSMHDDEPYVLEALRYGVSAYVLKGDATSDLLSAVQAAIDGRRFLSAPLAERAIDIYAQGSRGSEQPLDRYELLTAREREVLQLAAQGQNNAQIGDRLAISPRTAETHRANFMRKLRLASQTELVRFAMDRSLLPDGQ